jgi:release factor glutamine methyltransferase
MSVQLSSHVQVLVAERLRAAGCVFAEDEARLLVAAALTPAALEDMVGRRIAGLPLEQILGWAEFCGLRIAVAPGVFVPRRRTEFLASKAIDLVRRAAGPPVAVDLCCGSGAVAAALADAVDGLELSAADIDPEAVRCARRNIGAAGQVLEGDLYTALPVDLRGRVCVLVANAPYVPTSAIGMMPPEARLHEPQIALDGGRDGLDIQRRVVAAAHEWLAPGGHLLVETGPRQLNETARIFERHGLAAQVHFSAELDAAVVIGTIPGK